MNFEQFMNDEQRNYERVKHLGEESQIRNGADVARSLGISRVAVKKHTQKGITKIYKIVADELGDDSSPLKNVVHIAYMFGVENDQKGLETIFKNLSPEQKEEVIADVQKNYPGYLKYVKGGKN